MKNLIAMMVLVASVNVQAAKYESKSRPVRNAVSDADFSTAWNGSAPVCVKEKNRLLYINKAFVSGGLKFSDCTDTSKKSVKFTVKQLSEASIKLAEQN